jgi:hypothetical protein
MTSMPRYQYLGAAGGIPLRAGVLSGLGRLRRSGQFGPPRPVSIIFFENEFSFSVLNSEIVLLANRIT